MYYTFQDSYQNAKILVKTPTKSWLRFSENSVCPRMYTISVKPYTPTVLKISNLWLPGKSTVKILILPHNYESSNLKIKLYRVNKYKSHCPWGKYIVYVFSNLLKIPNLKIWTDKMGYLTRQPI